MGHPHIGNVQLFYSKYCMYEQKIVKSVFSKNEINRFGPENYLRHFTTEPHLYLSSLSSAVCTVILYLIHIPINHGTEMKPTNLSIIHPTIVICMRTNILLTGFFVDEGA